MLSISIAFILKRARYSSLDLPDVMRPEISVVLPTKEEEAVFETIKALRAMFPKGLEIIVVDKSSDAFFKKVRKTGVKAYRQTSRGVENAMIEGLRKSAGDIAISLDADGTHDLRGVKEGIKMIREGRADLVMGNRMGNLDPGSMSGYLKLGNTGLSIIYDILYLQGIHDVLTGMLIMSRKALDAVKGVKPRGNPIAFFQIEIAKRGFKVSEIPIAYHKRKYGESRLTNSKFRYGLDTASYMLKSKF